MLSLYFLLFQDVTVLVQNSQLFNAIRKKKTTENPPLEQFFAAVKCPEAETLSDQCINNMFKIIEETDDALMNVVFPE